MGGLPVPCVYACALLLLPQLQNKLSEARSTLQNSIDPNTGKRLFHPETGRAPRFSRNTSQQPVSEYLYSLSQQQVRAMRSRRCCCRIGMCFGSDRGQHPDSQGAHAEGWQAAHPAHSMLRAAGNACGHQWGLTGKRVTLCCSFD